MLKRKGLTNMSNLADATDKTVPMFSFDGINTTAKVVKVYDGDTCRIVFPFKGDLIKITLRLRNYNSPEIRSSDLTEKKAAYDARDRLRELINNKLVRAELGKNGKYGRTLAKIYIDENTCVNELMIEEGHGVPFMQSSTKLKIDHVI